MLMVFIRAGVMYLVVMITMRMMGKRMPGQLQPFELAVAMLIADLAAAPLGDLGIPLWYGVIPMLSLLFMHSIITLFSVRFPKLRQLFSGKPTILVHDGVIDNTQMEKLCYSINDLLEALRLNGQLDIAQVGTAVLETNGQLSAFPLSQNRPPMASELNLKPGREGVPLVLAMNGKAVVENLNVAMRNPDWLTSQLAEMKLVINEVLLCTLDTQGMLRVQDNNNSIHTRQAMSEQEVVF